MVVPGLSPVNIGDFPSPVDSSGPGQRDLGRKTRTTKNAEGKGLTSPYLDLLYSIVFCFVPFRSAQFFLFTRYPFQRGEARRKRGSTRRDKAGRR